MHPELNDKYVGNKNHNLDTRNHVPGTVGSNTSCTVTESEKRGSNDVEPKVLEEQQANDVVQYPDDCEIKGYLRHDVLSSPSGISYTEIEWPTLYWKTFTRFPDLPLELRRKIWVHTLPGPRLLRMANRNVSKRFGSSKDELIGGIELLYSGMSCGNKRELLPMQLLRVCRESHKIFREHYQRIGIQGLPDGKFIWPHDDKQSNVRICCTGYFDPKLDTLLYDFRAKNFWPSLQVRLDFSMVTDVAIVGFAAYERFNKSRWKLLETTFPQLKQLRVIVNHSDEISFAFSSEALRFGELLPVNHSLISQIQEAIWATQNHPPFYNERINRLHRNIIKYGSMHSLVYQAAEYENNFRGQIEENPDYWTRINLLPCLLICWGLHGHNMALKGNNSNQEKRKFFSRVPLANGGVGRISYRNTVYRFSCNTDGSLFDRYDGIKELFDGYKPITETEFLKWPWRYELPNHENIISES
ncbi:hypothetical protein NHQ30_005167 [Ciborinia camelliae]|nr:hypothetical protein NHQ30_005167 [Ciborinia camelliae]